MTYVRGFAFGLLVGVLLGMMVMFAIANANPSQPERPRIERYTT